MSDIVRRLVWCVQHGVLDKAEALARPDLTPDEKVSLEALLADDD